MSEVLKIENLSFAIKDAQNTEDAWSLRKSFFSRKAPQKHLLLDNVNLTLQRGETLCISGPSGQGKSLLLRIIAGLEKPDSGTFYFFGEYLPISKHNALEISKRQVRLVLQNVALISNLTVRENVALPLEYHKTGTPKEIEEKVSMALDIMRVRSVENQYPHTLSVGVKKRVSIARAWAMDPQLLLMDEPTAGLDNYNRRNLLPLIDNMRTLFKTSIIIISHDLMIAKELDCNLRFLHDAKLSESHSFDYWLNSKELFAVQLFRDLQKRGDLT